MIKGDVPVFVQFTQQVQCLQQALAAGIALAAQDLTTIRQESEVCPKLHDTF